MCFKITNLYSHYPVMFETMCGAQGGTVMATKMRFRQWFIFSWQMNCTQNNPQVPHLDHLSYVLVLGSCWPCVQRLSGVSPWAIYNWGVGDPGIYLWVKPLESSSPAMLPQVQKFGDINLLWKDFKTSAIYSSLVTFAPVASIIPRRLVIIQQCYDKSLEVELKWPLQCKLRLQNSD